jgi:hypothetical protein
MNRKKENEYGRLILKNIFSNMVLLGEEYGIDYIKDILYDSLDCYFNTGYCDKECPNCEDECKLLNSTLDKYYYDKFSIGVKENE